VSDNELAAFITFAITGCVTISAVAGSFFRYLGVKRQTQTLPKGTTAATDERLARIEQAIDAMAIEVERISEGQRFVTKLLADRTASERAPDAARLPASPPQRG
jgi:hypothetical protein